MTRIPAHDSEPETDPPPGVMRWLISCDESGVDGAPYYGFGTLWMAWQRRGDFSAVINALRKEHGYSGEFKWNKVKHQTLPFYRALVDQFFSTGWLSFHCLVVRKGMVKKELHGGSYDVARRKHFAKLLTNKIRQCVQAHPGRDQTFRVWVDPIASHYAKADEAVEVISNHVLKKVFGEIRLVDRVFTKDSKETPSIQLCDLLLGAVLDGWRKGSESMAKEQMRRLIAEHLGWSDLGFDTAPHERKFNIWYFHDASLGPREAKTRPVVLKHPLPAPPQRARSASR